jgi:hypothetical protein
LAGHFELYKDLAPEMTQGDSFAGKKIFSVTVYIFSFKKGQGIPGNHFPQN